MRLLELSEPRFYIKLIKMIDFIPNRGVGKFLKGANPAWQGELRGGADDFLDGLS